MEISVKGLLSMDLNDYLCFVMRAAMKKIERNLNNKICSIGISVPQWFVLYCLSKGDGMTLKEIGNRCMIDSSSMTVLIDKLERDGLVERRLDPHDRRAIRVSILPKGREAADQVSEIVQDLNCEMYNLVGEGRKKDFLQALNSIVAGLD